MKSVTDMVREANKNITTLTPKESKKMSDGGQAVLVDIRDVRELEQLGTINDAVHAPRGMLEFWVDPESPYHKQVFAQPDKTYILFCAAAGRSALAAYSLKEMGFENVAHIEGGFAEWQKQKLPIVEYKNKQKNSPKK